MVQWLLMGRLPLKQQQQLLQTLRLAVFGVTLASVLTDPQWHSHARDLEVVEVFTTAPSVVSAARAAGCSAEPYDILVPGCASALTKDGFQQILRLVLRLRVGGLLCLAPCCKSFIFAPRRWTCRTALNVTGDTSRGMVRDGNLMAHISMFMFCLAVLRGAEALLENPAGSMIFRQVVVIKVVLLL